MSNEKLLKEILENQAVIYAKLLQIEDRLKNVSSTSNRVAEAVKAFNNLRADVQQAHTTER